jgi:hypothetical protein
VDLKGLRLGERLGLLGSLQSDPSLEGSGVSLSFACHDAPRDELVTFDRFNIPSSPVSGIRFIIARVDPTEAR